jgi:hypothetical protein
MYGFESKIVKSLHRPDGKETLSIRQRVKRQNPVSLTCGEDCLLGPGEFHQTLLECRQDGSADEDGKGDKHEYDAGL